MGANNDSLSFLVVDDFSVVRKGVELLLKSNFAGCNVVAVESYAEALESLNLFKFDLIILDITMNGFEDLSIIEKIKEKRSFVSILIFSSHDEKKYGPRFIKSGANGYLNKECSDDVFIEAVVKVMNKGKFYSDELNDILKTRKDTLDETISQLSDRELEVYNLLIKGYGSLEISNELGIHMSTVSTYKNRLFKKLGVTNIVELVDFSTKN